MSFTRLQGLIADKKAPIAVGLDPRPSMLGKGETLFDFNKRIIDATVELVPAVKPQAAFYEAFGTSGLDSLRYTIKYARQQGLYVILDAKRGDIGSTAEAYAEAYFAKGSAFECDALTVNAYLGSDGIKPFLKLAQANDKAIFALVKTSNPSSGELQDLITDTGEPVYVRVAKTLDAFGDTEHLGFVVGATYPQQLAELRAMFPATFFLVPGYGAQGGDAADIAPAFANGGCAIVNNSRGIIAAENPRSAVLTMKDDLLSVCGL
ncbi:MAG: orotidine-5'-phosphate decarboxylase [Oscillospiraceae bacterium]|jgi:orotidine-5'-phosphate decarboxylase|nr:orotidine-5'-phosphate decarboxylase [Oscillospiraceae bacterium]